YRPFPDLAVNGHQTLSENIADLAGLGAAHDAYQLSLKGKPPDDKQFFISFAQSWGQKSREEALRQQIATDGHAPDQYRAATVRNRDPCYAAFAVKPDRRCISTRKIACGYGERRKHRRNSAVQSISLASYQDWCCLVRLFVTSSVLPPSKQRDSCNC